MFNSQKRIFAGKQNLQPEPFCPYLTNRSGKISLLRSSNRAISWAGQPLKARPSLYGGKPRF